MSGDQSLATPWTFWLDLDPPAGVVPDPSKYVVKVAEFDSVPSFWTCWTEVEALIPQLPDRCCIRCLRSSASLPAGLSPQAGRLRCHASSPDALKQFLDVLLLLIGESKKSLSNVSGASYMKLPLSPAIEILLPTHDPSTLDSVSAAVQPILPADCQLRPVRLSNPPVTGPPALTHALLSRAGTNSTSPSSAASVLSPSSANSAGSGLLAPQSQSQRSDLDEEFPPLGKANARGSEEGKGRGPSSPPLDTWLKDLDSTAALLASAPLTLKQANIKPNGAVPSYDLSTLRDRRPSASPKGRLKLNWDAVRKQSSMFAFARAQLPAASQDLSDVPEDAVNNGATDPRASGADRPSPSPPTTRSGTRPPSIQPTEEPNRVSRAAQSKGAEPVNPQNAYLQLPRSRHRRESEESPEHSPQHARSRSWSATSQDGGAGGPTGAVPNSPSTGGLITSADVRRFLSSFTDFYLVELVGGDPAPLDVMGVLCVEGCPMCLSLDLLDPSGLEEDRDRDRDPSRRAKRLADYRSLVVLTCRNMYCRHVLHLPCLANLVAGSSAQVPSLERTHTSELLRTIAFTERSGGSIAAIPRDPPGQRPYCTLELTLSHVLSNTQIIRIAWPHTVSSLADEHTGTEYVLLKLPSPGSSTATGSASASTPSAPADQELPVIPRLTVTRGRMSFKCANRVTLDTWQHDCFYDLTTVTTDTRSVRLIRVDPVSHNTLTIGLQAHRRPRPGSEGPLTEEEDAPFANGDMGDVEYSITFIKYEFCALYAARPTAVEPVKPSPAALSALVMQTQARVTRDRPRDRDQSRASKEQQPSQAHAAAAGGASPSHSPYQSPHYSPVYSPNHSPHYSPVYSPTYSPYHSPRNGSDHGRADEPAHRPTQSDVPSEPVSLPSAPPAAAAQTSPSSPPASQAPALMLNAGVRNAGPALNAGLVFSDSQTGPDRNAYPPYHPGGSAPMQLIRDESDSDALLRGAASSHHELGLRTRDRSDTEPLKQGPAPSRLGPHAQSTHMKPLNPYPDSSAGGMRPSYLPPSASFGSSDFHQFGAFHSSSSAYSSSFDSAPSYERMYEGPGGFESSKPLHPHLPPSYPGAAQHPFGAAQNRYAQPQRGPVPPSTTGPRRMANSRSLSGDFRELSPTHFGAGHLSPHRDARARDPAARRSSVTSSGSGSDDKDGSSSPGGGRSGVPPLTVAEAAGRIVLLCKTHDGSRFVQDKLEAGDPNDFAIFFAEMKDHIASLMMDSFGHFAAEKLIRKCSDEQLLILLRRLAPDMVTVSCQKHGSFSVQAMMDCIRTQEQINALVDALRDCVPMILHSSGHFVILRFLQRFPEHNKFLLDLIETNCLDIGTDHHGLRVVKAVLQCTPVKELSAIFKEVTRLTTKLVENQYGNYIIQAVMDVAPKAVCTNIKVKMEGKYLRLSKQKFSSNVVERNLRNSSPNWRGIIIKELTSQPAVGEVLRDRYGNYCLQTALAVANAEQVAELITAITPHLPTLRDNVRAKWENILKQAQERVRAEARSGKVVKEIEDD